VSKDVTFEEEVSFRRSRGSHMEIDSERQEEMVPSPPHPPIVQREIVEPIDPIDLIDHVAPVDVPRDIAVGRKRPTWAHQTLQEVEGHASSSWYLPREKETSEIFVLCRNYEPHH
jgi:hypothetical protein